MARVFTTTFLCNGKTYTAVISQVNGWLNIFLPDESLHAILPKGRISLDAEKGLRIDRPRLTRAQNLVLTILSTVECRYSSALQTEKE